MRPTWTLTVIVTIAIIVVAYALVVRPWSMSWGATDDEVARRLPGDSLAPAGVDVATCAVTIHAPSAEVWAWLVQLGQGRGGFYSYEWLENLFAADMHNAGTIIPELQSLRVGDRVYYQKDGPFGVVTMLDPGRTLVIGSGWTFVLVPVDPATTRLIVRYPYDPITSTPYALYYHAIFEPAHFVMEVGMMLGIKQRAERSFHQRVTAERPISEKAP